MMWVLIIVISVLLGTAVVLFIGAAVSRNFVNTPSFKGPDGKVLPKSIAEFRRVILGGYSQAVLIRGRNIDNPVLLYLHMGPGLSEMGVSRNMNALLEDHYTMVHWDQRGAGKSYSLFLDTKTMTVDQFIEDTHELTLYLKKKLNKEKIILMGHSWGSGLGPMVAARYPEDYSAYIGMGQIVNPLESDRLSYGIVVEKAKKSKNEKAVKELEKINNYWLLRDAGYLSEMMTNKKWIGYFGGQIYGQKNFSFVFKNMMCDEFTLFDWAPLALGSRFSGNAVWKVMFTTDLMKQVPEFKMPFILLMGRHDYNSVPELTEKYFIAVKAPVKKIFWFEQSAHFPNYEEPDAFHKVMIESVLPMIMGN